MSRTVYVNGAYVPEEDAKISVFDRGFLFADGVYEVTSVIGGKLIDFAGHCARLRRSLAELEMPSPADDDALLAIHRELLERNAVEEGMVYLQVTRGAADRDFAYPAEPEPSLVMFTQSKGIVESPAAEAGIDVITIPDLRWGRRDIKTVQLLYPSMGKMAAKAAGAADAWMVEDGAVTEGTSNNAYIVTGGTIVTRHLGARDPGRDHAVRGAALRARGADAGGGAQLHRGGGDGCGRGVRDLGLDLRDAGGADRRRGGRGRRAGAGRAAAAGDLSGGGAARGDLIRRAVAARPRAARRAPQGWLCDCPKSRICSGLASR